MTRLSDALERARTQTDGQGTASLPSMPTQDVSAPDVPPTWQIDAAAEVPVEARLEASAPPAGAAEAERPSPAGEAPAEAHVHRAPEMGGGEGGVVPGVEHHGTGVLVGQHLVVVLAEARRRPRDQHRLQRSRG